MTLLFHKADQKKQKTAENKRKKKSSTDDDEDLDLESLDWWSKYFASVDTLIQVWFHWLLYLQCTFVIIKLRFDLKKNNSLKSS